jgi:hypothetical protein
MADRASRLGGAVGGVVQILLCQLQARVQEISVKGRPAAGATRKNARVASTSKFRLLFRRWMLPSHFLTFAFPSRERLFRCFEHEDNLKEHARCRRSPDHELIIAFLVRPRRL